MFHGLPLLALLLLASCSGRGLSLFGHDESAKRQIASIAMERLLTEEDESFEAQIDEKLFSLHCYYVIAQKHLLEFERSIDDSTLEKLYQGEHYLSLLATRTQIDEIERDLKELSLSLNKERRSLLEKKLRTFKEKNLMTSLSLSNLSHLIGVETQDEKNPKLSEIEKEYQELEKTKNFQVYEKNIEHLSHMMETNLSTKAHHWKPSPDPEGSLSGQEFPEKVWSLTFSGGPHEKLTQLILENLKEENLKATFFQEGSRAENLKVAAKNVLQYGMEIGTQSMTQKELSKVGMLTLEREITVATKSMEKSLKLDIKFFRLPYGSGIEVPNVRQMLAKNKLIHVFWNIDSLDWPPQTPDRIIMRTKKLMKKTPRDAGVILFHDTHPRTVVASREIMSHLKLDNRRVCTLGTIVGEMNQGQKKICSKTSM